MNEINIFSDLKVHTKYDLNYFVESIRASLQKGLDSLRESGYNDVWVELDYNYANDHEYVVIDGAKKKKSKTREQELESLRKKAEKLGVKIVEEKNENK